MEIKLKRNRRTGEKKDLRNRTQGPQETPTHQTANKTKRALERAMSTDKIMRERKVTETRIEKKSVKQGVWTPDAKQSCGWKQLLFLRGLGIVTRESKVLWFLRSSLSPSSLEWSFGNEQKQKGLQQTEQRRSFGRPKKKENQMSFKGFLRQHSLGLNTTSWDDNEWALRGEERSTGHHSVLLLMFFWGGGGGGALCRSGQ